ncbi:carboxyvinyl-carboxyphosphonate phosphorylmutase [Georhizobium profundi]|jgi:2-methylisocitrate lyase-like PEP mutase family enzyme|uniref:2-methylisocitrate lyase n=1 Tax=Georhizobium profundi TaxID=2341112 RepID=A0A3S9B4Q3_9HYPH|nr:isocitrate lyase/PEP mutase family protein [Georhizobium profundi]AZN71912.1 carboxyvinyl-carboxyphosphonate phosphorylmutase [Georhizobium profundi]
MTRLKARLAEQRIVVAPGIYDGLSALVAEQSGAEAIYLSGASLAYTRFGRPDIGLVSVSEVADAVGAICERVSLPLIVDGDTGFGNALNVQRTVRMFERMGAAAIQIEDQTMPKRCGHLNGKSLVSTGEMVGKIKAAADARQDEHFVVIARTDAIGVDGFQAGLDRGAAYAEAGADVVFVEAPRSVDEMESIVSTLGSRVPLMANMVEGGKTPTLTANDLEAIGFSLVIFPGGLTRAVARTMRAYFESLLAHGSNAPFKQHMYDFAGINAVVGTDEMLAAGAAYDEKRFEP